MSNGQEKIGDSIKGMTDRQAAFVSGVQRGATMTGDTLERLSGFQLALAADGVDAAIAQVRLLGQPGNPVSYLKRQVELVSTGVENVTGKAGELSEVFGECASDLAALFEIAPKKTASRNRKAA